MLLDSLPVELLYEVQTFALSTTLPLTSRYLYAVYKSAPSSVHAAYLIGRYLLSAHASRAGLVSVVLRYPLCTQEVLEAIFRSPDCPPLGPRELSIPTELPRRLFRALIPRDPPPAAKKRKREDADDDWTADDEPLPFLRYIYDHPRIPKPYTNSYDGYALTKAVHVGFVPLVRFLLEHDASPAYKNGLAVMVAIRRKDLKLVRMLIERDDRETSKRARMADGQGEGVSEGRTAQVEKNSRANEGEKQTAQKGNKAFRSSKRRKLEDRVQVNQEMLKTAVKCDARSIVEYLMKEKGCAPDIQTVLMMSSSG